MWPKPEQMKKKEKKKEIQRFIFKRKIQSNKWFEN